MTKTSSIKGFLRTEEGLQEIEAASLAPCAQLSCWATRRYEMETEGKQFELRTSYQRDRDRIVHSRAFRRLKHKTQVFIPYTNDHQRTRLTHTIEVMQLARTIARCLGLNEDLTEAIALGHDVGHTPFGHVGERTIRSIMKGELLSDTIPAELLADAGGFKHNVQSLRVVDKLELRYKHPGLNLSDQTREGILKHTTWKAYQEYPQLDLKGLNVGRRYPHFEGQVVAVADEIAQQTHDLEDGIRGGMVPEKKLLELRIVKRIMEKNESLQDKKMSSFTRQNTIIRSLIHVLVVDVINEGSRRLEAWCDKHKVKSHDDFKGCQDKITECVSISPELKDMFIELRQFVYETIINSRHVKLNDESGEYFTRELFRLYYDDPTMLAWYVLEEYRRQRKIKHLHQVARFHSEAEVKEEIRANYYSRPEFIRLISDYLSGMSNTYAIREYEKWVMPLHG